MRTSQLLLGLLACVIASTAFAANRPAGYVTICNEGKTCSVPANTQVAYGRADKFTFKILSGSFVCGEVTFGTGTKVSGGTNECSIPSNTSAVSSSKAASSSSRSSVISSAISSVISSSRSSIISSVSSSNNSSSSSVTSSVSYSSLPAGDGLVGWG
ncbi:MAG TPA: pectate lyase, partial [Cellvibrio sp.]|nr:pectate lyase [Cellvibrio sp.]